MIANVYIHDCQRLEINAESVITNHQPITYSAEYAQTAACWAVHKYICYRLLIIVLSPFPKIPSVLKIARSHTGIISIDL